MIGRRARRVALPVIVEKGMCRRIVRGKGEPDHLAAVVHVQRDAGGAAERAQVGDDLAGQRRSLSGSMRGEISGRRLNAKLWQFGSIRRPLNAVPRFRISVDAKNMAIPAFQDRRNDAGVVRTVSVLILPRRLDDHLGGGRPDPQVVVQAQFTGKSPR